MPNTRIHGRSMPMLFMIALALSIALAGCIPSGNGVSDNADLVGQPAPEIQLSDLSGKEFNLQDARGKIVLLDFWATWCPPCLRALPHIQSLHQEFQDQGLVVLGINNEDAEKVATFAEEKGLTFRTLSDPSGMTFSAYGVEGIPTTVLVDREGVVQTVLVGYTSEERMRAALLELGVETESDPSNE